MIRNKQLFILLLLIVVIVTSGCSKGNPHKRLSKDDQSLVWISDRERAFGDSDYVDLKTEEEAFKVLKNKYKVAIPPYYEQAKKLVAKDITTDAVQPGETKYLILARDKEVEFRTVYTFYQEEKLQTMAVINFYYTFSSDAKKARLERQVVNIKIAPANGKLPKDNYKEITQDLGALMKLPEPTISEGIQGFEKQIKESGKQFKNESVAIVTNSVGLNKNEELAKSISAIYDGGGNLKEIYAEIWDQTE